MQFPWLHLDSDLNVDLSKIPPLTMTCIKEFNKYGSLISNNFDGILFYSGMLEDATPNYRYTQIYENGILEAVNASRLKDISQTSQISLPWVREFNIGPS